MSIIKEKLMRNKSSYKVKIPVWPLILFCLIFIHKYISLLNSELLIPRIDEHSIAGFVSRMMIEDLCLFSGALSLLIILIYFNLNKIGNFILALFFVFYFLDEQVYLVIFQRFTYIYAQMYFDEFRAISSFISIRKIVFLAAIILMIIVTGKLRYSFSYSKIKITILLAIFFVPWFIDFYSPYAVGHHYDAANIFRVNLNVVTDPLPTKDSIQKIIKRHPGWYKNYMNEFSNDAISCSPNINRSRQNIILLISESLSAVDSYRTGGLFNRLPLIDSIQERGITLTNLVSDGMTTTDGVVSLLTGVGIFPTGNWESDAANQFPLFNHSFSLKNRSLAVLANNLGYKTIFTTNSPLSFEGYDAWLPELGFDLVDGGESSYYSGLPRYTFSSPEDKHLYNRAISLIEPLESPYLLVMLNISFHIPYILPDENLKVGENAMLNVLNYVDQTTFAFYKKLEEMGFFNNGVLVIVGDHRRMTPFEREEIKKYGIEANGKIVGTIIGNGISAGLIDDSLLNLSDLNALSIQILCGSGIDKSIEKYNKGYRLGLNEVFVTHMLNLNYAKILVRKKNKSPLVITMNSDILKNIDSWEEDDQKILAYLAFGSNWLNSLQKGERIHLGPGHK